MKAKTMDVSKAARDCALQIFSLPPDAELKDYKYANNAAHLIQVAMDQHAESRCAELREALVIARKRIFNLGVHSDKDYDSNEKVFLPMIDQALNPADPQAKE